MKLILVSCFNSLFILTAAAQIWDLVLFPEESEQEDDEFLDEESDDYENSTTFLAILKMSSSEILDEQRLLAETSEIIINEISDEIHEELMDRYIERIDEIISDHTVDLYNVIHSLESQEKDLSNEKKLKFHDIFVYSNESDKINEILNGYYEERR